MLINDPPVEITENLLMLGTNEYPLFLFKGTREGAVIEGGVGPMGPLVLEQLEDLAIGRDFIKQLIILHGHPDHVMAVPSLREALPAVTVIASPAAKQTLLVEKALSFFCKVDEQLTDSLLKAGVIDQRHRPKPLAEMQIAVDQIVEDGDTINIDGTSFNVLETPGHSDCSLSLHEPLSGVLFISDASGYYMHQHDYWWPNYFVGYGVYIDTMRRLARLDAEIICLGHLAVIKGAGNVKSYFDAAIAATEQFHQRIVDEAKAGRPVRQIAEMLGAEVYKKTQLMPLEFLQKNCGLLVKQSFKHEGIEVEKK